MSVSVLIALLVVFSPELFPLPSYDELYEKTITVSSYARIPQYRGGHSYRVYTKDDGTFTVTGQIDHAVAEHVFQSGVKVTVKGYRSCAEEIIVDGEVIVKYNNDDPVDRVPLMMLGLLFILVGVGYAVGSLWWEKHRQSLEEKRDKRIKKKYSET